MEMQAAEIEYRSVNENIKIEIRVAEDNERCE